MLYLAIFYRVVERTSLGEENAMLGAVMFPTLEEALKIRGAFEQLEAGYRVNVHHVGDPTDQLTPASVEAVNVWLRARGYEDLPAELKLVR